MQRCLLPAAVACLWVISGAPAVAQILPAGAVPTKLTPASVGGINIVFTEGALWDGNGGVYFSDMHNSSQPTTNPSRILHYDIASGTTTVADALSGGTNGMYRDANGQVVTCDRDGLAKPGQTRQISLRSASDVSVVEAALATSYNGKAFNGPNDLVIDANGGIYFTDPDYENRKFQPDEGVYYLSPPASGSGQRTITKLIGYSYANLNDLHRPNGIILSPNGKTLYLALEQDFEILSFDLTQPNFQGQVFAHTDINPDGTKRSTNNGPDGLTIDPAGNVYAAMDKSVWAWNPDGKELFRMNMPGGSSAEDPTNVDFGGADGKTLFIAAGKGLYGVHLNIATPATGDYNGNGAVDAADYTVWRDSIGSTTNFAADGTGDHVIDQADYDWWVGKFAAAGTASGSTGQQNAVPEPGSLALAVIALLSLLCFRSRSTNY